MGVSSFTDSRSGLLLEYTPEAKFYKIEAILRCEER